LIILPPPRSTLFPYTTLFRSVSLHDAERKSKIRPQFAPEAQTHGLTNSIFMGLDTAEFYFGSTHRFLLWNAAADQVLGMAFNVRSEEHTSELQSRGHLVCRLL